VIIDLQFEGSDGHYLVNMNVSLCTEAGQPCDVIIPIFDNSALPKETCNRKQDFLDQGKIHIL
jgi:hypothetical protein